MEQVLRKGEYSRANGYFGLKYLNGDCESKLEFRS